MCKLKVNITDNAGERNLWVIRIVLYGKSGLGVFEKTGVWL